MYNQYANHPAYEDFANQYKAEWNAASLAYTLELKRLVDAYRMNPCLLYTSAMMISSMRMIIMQWFIIMVMEEPMNSCAR